MQSVLKWSLFQKGIRSSWILEIKLWALFTQNGSSSKLEVKEMRMEIVFSSTIWVMQYFQNTVFIFWVSGLLSPSHNAPYRWHSMTNTCSEHLTLSMWSPPLEWSSCGSCHRGSSYTSLSVGVDFSAFTICPFIWASLTPLSAYAHPEKCHPLSMITRSSVGHLCVSQAKRWRKELRTQHFIFADPAVVKVSSVCSLLAEASLDHKVQRLQLFQLLVWELLLMPAEPLHFPAKPLLCLLEVEFLIGLEPFNKPVWLARKSQGSTCVHTT